MVRKVYQFNSLEKYQFCALIERDGKLYRVDADNFEDEDDWCVYELNEVERCMGDIVTPFRLELEY